MRGGQFQDASDRQRARAAALITAGGERCVPRHLLFAALSALGAVAAPWACREPRVATIALKRLPPPPEWKAEDHVYVARVLSGDTFLADRNDGKRHAMTLQGLTAPGRFEGDVFHGASLFLAELIEGRRVIIETPTAGAPPDAEGRVPCWVFLSGTNVNLAVLDSGWAKRNGDAPRFEQELADAEHRARDARRGVWAPRKNSPGK